MHKRDLLRAGALAGLGALATPGILRAQAQRPGVVGAFEDAEAAFIFGLPIVMNYAVMYEFAIDRNSGQYKAPFNTMWNDSQVFTWRDTAIPTPNSDTPYSMSWLDLRAEPVVISVPDVPAGRYFSVQVCDGNTYNVGYIGSRTTGQGAGSWIVAGPGWQGATPPGVRGVIRSTTQFALAIFRTQLIAANDMPNVVAVQRGYRAEPLSTFLRPRRRPRSAGRASTPTSRSTISSTTWPSRCSSTRRSRTRRPCARRWRASGSTGAARRCPTASWTGSSCSPPPSKASGRWRRRSPPPACR
jgi:hypothetical protein